MTTEQEPVIAWIATHDERWRADGTYVIERTYECRICGKLKDPCEHFSELSTGY